MDALSPSVTFLFLLRRSAFSGQRSKNALARCPVVVFVDSLRQLSAIVTGFFFALIAGGTGVLQVLFRFEMQDLTLTINNRRIY